jgi:hypothetical protein
MAIATAGQGRVRAVGWRAIVVASTTCNDNSLDDYWTMVNQTNKTGGIVNESEIIGPPRVSFSPTIGRCISIRQGILSRFLLFVLTLAGFAIGGCTSISVGSADGQEFAGIGFYRVKLPATQGSLVAVDRESVGIGWGSLVGSAAFLGYDKSEWIVADPENCQLLIVIKSAAQAENAKEIIELLGDQSPCIVDQTGSLRPSQRP